MVPNISKCQFEKDGNKIVVSIKENQPVKNQPEQSKITAIPEASPDQIWLFVIWLFIAVLIYAIARIIAWYRK